MRLSEYFLPTLKEFPKDAEIISPVDATHRHDYAKQVLVFMFGYLLVMQF